MTERWTTIELFKESFKFSAGHFTIFDEKNRENIHGHNFSLYVSFDALIERDGIIFDYSLAKQYIQNLCGEYNEFFLVPEKSRHLRIEKDSNYTYLHFNNEKIPFLHRDVKFLPVENITVEDLSQYFLDIIVKDFVLKNNFAIRAAEVKVFSGPGQCSNARWVKNKS